MNVITDRFQGGNSDLRPELEEPPAGIAALPVHRGYPVPWFVEWVKRGEDGVARGMPIGQGEPDFRIMSPERYVQAIREERCWVCGGPMMEYRAFVIGPMCAVSRTSAEPPGHVNCGQWSARNCPFLARPHARRREAGLPETVPAPGVMIKRNPGVAGVWVVHKDAYRRFAAPSGGQLFNIGEPTRVSWWAEGREATRQEVAYSISTGLPLLREQCDMEDTPERCAAAHAALTDFVDRAAKYLPAAETA